MPKTLLRDPITALPAWAQSLREWIDRPLPPGWWDRAVDRPGVEVGTEALRALLHATGITDPVSQLLAVAGTRVPVKQQRAIAEARAVLQKAGPAAPGLLSTVLTTVEPKFQHHVIEGLPGVPPPQRRVGRILRPSHADVYNLSPTASERVQTLTRDIGGALPYQGNWGGSRDPEMLYAFAHDRQASDLYGDIFASLSPSTMVPKNTKESVAVWLDYLRDPGRPWTRERLRELGVGNVGSKRDNIIRSIHGLPLSGPKVEPFSTYMSRGAHRLDPPRVAPRLPVPDMHYLRGLGTEFDSMARVIPELRELVERTEGIPARGGGLAQRDYVRRLNEAVADELQLADPTQTMGPLFAQYWNASRAYQGLPFQGGPIDILRPRGLAERGAMLDPRALAAALRDPRPWTALLGGALAIDDPLSVGEAPPPPPELLPSH